MSLGREGACNADPTAEANIVPQQCSQRHELESVPTETQLGEVEACELLRTLCTVLGRILQSNGTMCEEEVACVDPCHETSLQGFPVQGFPLMRELVCVCKSATRCTLNSLSMQESEDCSEPMISQFHGHRIPQISMRDYVMRISTYSKCSNICCVMAYSYMQRLAKVGSSML